MKFAVEYNPEFFNDLVHAVDWYNDRQIGLGIDTYAHTVRRHTSTMYRHIRPCCMDACDHDAWTHTPILSGHLQAFDEVNQGLTVKFFGYTNIFGTNRNLPPPENCVTTFT